MLVGEGTRGIGTRGALAMHRMTISNHVTVPRSGPVQRLVATLEARLRRQRELLWHPRLELAAARQMARTNRRLVALRRTPR